MPEENELVDSNTQEEINRLIRWAANLIPLDVEKIQFVDPNIKKEEIVYEKRKIDEIFLRAIQIISNINVCFW